MPMNSSLRDGLTVQEPIRYPTSGGLEAAVESASAGKLQSKLCSLHLPVCFIVSN